MTPEVAAKPLDAADATEATDATDATEALDAPIAEELSTAVDELEVDALDTTSGSGCPAFAGGE